MEYTVQCLGHRMVYMYLVDELFLANKQDIHFLNKLTFFMEN